MSITKEELKQTKKQAKSGDLSALCELGEYYFRNKGYKKEKKYVGLYKKAAKSGSADAYYWLSRYSRIGDIKERVEFCRKAAELGHLEAILKLAQGYRLGIAEHGFEHNANESLKWYLKAAEMGHIESQIEVGNIYFCGSLYPSKIPKDTEKAFYWYSLAAERGNEEALYNCAFYYYYNKNDYDKAREICIDLANNGQSERYKGNAMYLLGSMYYYRCGVKYNKKTAYSWYTKAAALGNESAEEMVCFISGKPKPNKQTVSSPSVNLDNVAKRLLAAEAKTSPRMDDFIIVPKMDLSDM